MAAYVNMRSEFEDPNHFQEGPNLRNDPEILFRPMHGHPKYSLSQQNEFRKNATPSRYFGVIFGLADAFCENVLAHPFIVLRRQCQVHQNSCSYHLLPFTLLPVVFKLQGRQGIGTLWKGIGSVFIVKGLMILSEDVISKITQWPKEITYLHSIPNIFQHLILKFISAAVASPFYSACLVETVQSDVASEKPAVFDCIAEGLGRIIPHKHPPTSRVLSVWILAMPTAAHGVLHYVVSSAAQHIAMTLWKLRKSRKACKHQEKEDTVTMGFAKLFTSFIGHVTADVLLYPIETVLNRLHIQGTRTIIDNLDTGGEVTPIITKYEGPVDCLQTIVDEEGAAGLFKGFGALVLQYLFHVALISGMKFVFVELRDNWRTTTRVR